LRFRFSVLMFLQYAAPSALVQLYSLHLQQLGFTPWMTGICSATQALATVVVALLVGQAADRWFSAERCLAVCALLASITLWFLAGATSFWPVSLLTFLFWLLVNPTLQLGTTICFIHLRDPDRDYGSIRLWGTVGWMVPGWLLLLLTWLTSADANAPARCTDLFRLGSIFALALGLYALTIPHSPPRPGKDRRPAPLAALTLLGNSSFIIYCICTLGVCVTYPFTTMATPLLLRNLGVSTQWLSPIMSLSQVTEILTLALLPMFMLRLGVRGAMLMGLIAWTLVMLILSLGQPKGLVISSLGLNGLFVPGFLVVGQVFVNRHATGDLRASAQSLLTFVNGLGQFLGHLLVGWLRGVYDGDLPRAFMVSAVITVCLLVLFLVGFHEWGGTPLSKLKQPVAEPASVPSEITSPAATEPL
jgi:MFS family permease